MNQCKKIQQQLLDEFGGDSNSNSRDQTAGDLMDHLRQCAACRLYRRSLQGVAAKLNDFGVASDAGISLPGISYFERLVAETVTATKQAKSRQTLQREVSVFLGLGILIMTGAVLAVSYGYWLPVVIIFSLVSMQAPVLILLREPEAERGGLNHEN